jgi:PAS domain-containing protein
MPIGGSSGFDIGGSATAVAQEQPKNLMERFVFILDTKVMPYFYGLLFKHDLKFVGAGVFALFILVNLVVSVQPLVDLGTRLVVAEATLRARFMAKQIVDRNALLVAQRAEIKAETGNFEKEPGVRAAVLIDLENRIIAPASKLNQYFTRGDAATYAAGQKKKFLNGQETGLSTVLEDNSVVAVEPLKVFDPAIGRNRVAALSVVWVDTEGANPAFTELGTSYADTLVRSGIFALIALFVLYRITMKPFQVLNEDIDRVLRGEMAQVTHEFKIEELDSLWGVINSALTRIPRGGSSSVGSDLGGMSLSDVDPTDSFKDIASFSPFAAVVLDADGKVAFMNSGFENLTNARLDDVRGKSPAEAFGEGIPEYIESVMRRIAGGEKGVSTTLDTSTGSYQLYGSASFVAGVPKAWMMSAVRSSV